MPEAHTRNADEKSKQKLKEWLKDRNNLALIGILIFAFFVRLFYFILTKNQPLWWDEAGYMAAAKTYAGIGNYQLESIRLPGFPLLMSIFFRIGLTSEPFMRFIALLIPSIILIFLTYIMIKEMYPDKKVALISTAILSVLWENLFYSNRFHTENLALIFEFLAIFILFKTYMKKENAWFITPKYSLIWIALLSFISIIFRPGNIMFVPAVFLFIIILNRSFFLSKKGLLVSGIFIVLAIIAAFIVLPRMAPEGFAGYYHPENPFAWNVLAVFYGFYQSIAPWIPSVFFYTFLFGLLILVLDISIGFAKLKKISRTAEDLELKSDIFNVILLVSVLFIFIFLMRPYTGFEYRWFFVFLPAMLAFTSKGAIALTQYIGDIVKSNKVSTILLLVMVVLGVYTQVVFADRIIDDKLTSYIQVKQSGLWLKDNANPSDIIVTASVPQHAYYSERTIYNFNVNGTSNDNEAIFTQRISQAKPRYLVLSSIQRGFTPDWAYTWPQRNNQTAIPVQIYYADVEKTMPVLIVYELKFSRNSSY